MPTPEYLACLQIDQLLTAAGVVQLRHEPVCRRACGVRELPVEAGLKRAARLRQAVLVLKAAFEGRL